MIILNLNQIRLSVFLKYLLFLTRFLGLSDFTKGGHKKCH